MIGPCKIWWAVSSRVQYKICAVPYRTIQTCRLLICKKTYERALILTSSILQASEHTLQEQDKLALSIRNPRWWRNNRKEILDQMLSQPRRVYGRFQPSANCNSKLNSLLKSKRHLSCSTEQSGEIQSYGWNLSTPIGIETFSAKEFQTWKWLMKL